MDENFNGRMGHLTPEQTVLLAQFKQELQSDYDPAIHDDHTLLRFLRARQFRLPQAKEMWINYQKWRKEYGTDTVHTQFISDSRGFRLFRVCSCPQVLPPMLS